MEELEEAPSSSKMDQQDETEPKDGPSGMGDIKLPDQLLKIKPAEEFVRVRHRWNTNEELASFLIAFDKHKEWLMLPLKIRPASGSMLLYNRKAVFYRRDGYCWKKRRNGSTIREDHMKLKVQGLECIYGSYVHSAILPTFHRRCYWLLQNPNIVLIHYLNVPYPEAAKPSIPSLSHELRQKDWSKEELVDQLRPMLSREVEGTEHDVEGNQKVERILEELLPMLMQESSKASQTALMATKLIEVLHYAPEPGSTAALPSSSSTTPMLESASSSLPDNSMAHSLKRPMPASFKASKNQTKGHGGASAGMKQEQHLQGFGLELRPGQSRIHTLCHTNIVQPGSTSRLSYFHHQQVDIHQPNQADHSQHQQGDALPQMVQEMQHFSVTSEDTAAQAHPDFQTPYQAFLIPAAREDSSKPDNVSGTQAAAYVQDVIMAAADNLSAENHDGVNPANPPAHMAGHILTTPLQPTSLPTLSPQGTNALTAVTSLSSTQPLQAPHLNTGTSNFQTLQGDSLNSNDIKLYLQPHQQQATVKHSFSMTPSNSNVQENQSLQTLNPSSLTAHQPQHINEIQQQQQQQAQQPPLPQQPQQQPQAATPPVLTLHLKPSNSLASSSSGFVLSLQGATIVQPNSSAQILGSQVMTAGTPLPQGFVADSGGGITLVASQNADGGLVLNQVPVSVSAAQGVALSGPNQSSTPAGLLGHQAPEGASHVLTGSTLGQVCQSTNGGLILNQLPTATQSLQAPVLVPSHNTALQGLVLNQLPKGSHPVMVSAPGVAIAPRSSCDSLTGSHLRQPSPQQPGLLVSVGNSFNSQTATPVMQFAQSPQYYKQLQNQTVQVRITPQRQLIGDSLTQMTLSQTEDLTKSRSGSKAPRISLPKSPFSPSTESVVIDTTNTSSMAMAFGPSSSEAGGMADVSKSRFSSLSTQSPSSVASPLPSHGFMTHSPQQFHQSSSPNPTMMAGPSGNPSVLLTGTPNSCDTLDGSFSSLPSGDLNLDDLLDINDLEDVSDLSVSPFSPPTMASQRALTSPSDFTSSSGMCTTLVTSSQGASTSSQVHHGSLPPFVCGTEVSEPSHLRPLATPLCPMTSHAPPLCSLTSQTTPLCSMTPKTNTGQQSQADQDTHQLLYSTVTSESSGVQLPKGLLELKDTTGAKEGEDTQFNSVIKDFSPDWAYTKTSTKVLVAGPWSCQQSQYSCVFDGQQVPATLVQPGLLRCYTQYHNPGYVTLQVARNGVIISNCEVFEFCDREENVGATVGGHPEWFAIESHQLQLLLVERLAQFKRQFVYLDTPFQEPICDDLEPLESNLVRQVQSMVGLKWPDLPVYPKAGQHNLTLLHLAAGLGLAKLISALIRWRTDNSSVSLEFEVDAQSVDSHACTPLMWACALGKIDAALTLYHWNASPLKMCNKDGLLPLTVARQKGHYNLANQVEQLERAKEQQQQQQQRHLKQQQEQQQQSQKEQQNQEQCPDLFSNLAVSDTSMDVSSGSMAASHGTCDDPSTSSGVKEDPELKDELTIEIPDPQAFPKPNKPGPKLVRRLSEQVLCPSSRHLNKRNNSVDLLPSGQAIDQAVLPTLGSPVGQSVREANSEPQLAVSPDMAFVSSPAPRLLLEDKINEPTAYTGDPSTSKMDTDDPPIAMGSTSPLIDVERLSSDEEPDPSKDGSKHQMVTLANQIIAAIPERIKLSPSKGDDADDLSSGRGRTESHSSLPSQGSPRPSSFGDDSGISTPMTDSLAFEEYRYPEFGTPASSLSPDSTCLPSPYSPYNFTLDSPPPTTAEFTEYFNAPTTYMEKDFSQLTLSDKEQRKLYEAAKVIQSAYRHYRDKQQQQQQKEIEAAILIQSYYRRYKTYAYYKKMSHAAVLIQNQFRTYYARRKKRGDAGNTLRRESERLKKGRNQSVIIQQRFRSHYQRKSLDGKEGSSQSQGSNEAPDSSPAGPEGNLVSDMSSPAADADQAGTSSSTAPGAEAEDDDCDQLDPEENGRKSEGK